MSPLLNTAVSGMQASQVRLGVSANNVANAQTEGFQRSRVDLQAQQNGGVTARVERLPQSGVDLVQEMVEQKSATYAFKANAQSVRTADEMMGRLLDTRA